MLRTLLQFNREHKLENAITFSIALFIFKLIFPSADSLILILINELIVLTVVFLWSEYILEFIEAKTFAPLLVVFNVGILAALIFFIIIISSSIINDVDSFISDANFFFKLFAIFTIFLFMGASTYIFSAFKELFFLRQKKDPKTYFNTMLSFIILAAASSAVVRIYPDLDYIFNTFFVVSIILIVINSIRVAWIAFLSKKQKVALLLVSIVLPVLFGFNIALTSEANLANSILINFSPGLLTFIRLVMIYGAIYLGVIFFTTLFHLPTAEAFDRKAEEVSSMMDLSRLITQVFDINELAETVTRTTLKVSNADSAWLVTFQDENYELSSMVNIGFVEAESLTNKLLKSGNYDLSSARTINLANGSFSGNDFAAAKQYKALAVAPLKVHSEVIGYLFAARKREYTFDEDDKKAISAFADYAAIALENANLIEESLEKERLEKELDVAREIQYKILPSKTPAYKNLDISALFIPAFEVGGDYYDFFEISNDKLGFVIADVSGKGISAAFVMAEVKGIFESLSKLITDPKDLLIKANEILCTSLDKKTFVTAIYGIFDFSKSTLTFARAGHTPLGYLRDGSFKNYTPNGIGLGLDIGNKFSNVIKPMEINLNNNDIIILYTDGIPEAQNEKMDEFGYKKMENLLVENQGRSLDEISNILMKEVAVFSKDVSQHDDITLVLFKWNFNNKKVGDS